MFHQAAKPIHPGNQAVIPGHLPQVLSLQPSLKLGVPEEPAEAKTRARTAAAEAAVEPILWKPVRTSPVVPVPLMSEITVPVWPQEPEEPEKILTLSTHQPLWPREELAAHPQPAPRRPAGAAAAGTTDRA